MRHRLRFLIVLSTFLLSVLLYADRVCISAAKDAVALDLSLSDLQMGWVFSAFSLGYALLQAPGGWIADRLGPRRVLAIIVCVWSVFTGLTAVAGSWISLLIVRFLFGAGEAGAFPGMARAVYSWIPMNERGLVQGVNFSGSRIGAALALPAVAWLVGEFGWRATFVGLMCTGFVWAIAWYLCFRDDPESTPWLSDAERDYILVSRQQASKPAASVTPSAADDRTNLLRSILTSRTVWALCAQYFASNFVFFFGLTWFFPQLRQQYNLTGMQASLFAAVPMVFGALGNWFSGWWVDSLYRQKHWAVSRRIPAITGFILAAAGILGSAFAMTPITSSIWFSLCIFGADMTLSPSWTSCVDIGRRNSGVVSGTMNMAGNVGAFVTSVAFPYLLSWTDSSMPFFYIASGMNLMAVMMWLIIDPTVALKDQA